MKSGVKAIFRRLSLAQKFSAAVILLILLIMTIVNTLVINYQRGALKSEIENSHLIITKNLAKDAVEPLLFIDPLTLDGIIRTTAQTPGSAYAYIVDSDMRIVAHTDRKLLGQTLQGEVSEKIGNVRDKGEDNINLSGKGAREIIVPVKAGHEVVGAAVVGFSEEGVYEAVENNLRRLKNYIFLISGIIVFVGIGGAYGLARVLTTPVKKLRDKMELAQSGNLDVEIPNENPVKCWEILKCHEEGCPAYGKGRCWTVSGTGCFGKEQGDYSEKIKECKECIVYKDSCGDEIGELIEAFNQMVKKLKGSIKELEDAGKEKTRLEKLSALGEMSMTVAHEIKNPLNAIRGAVSYLQDNFRGEILKEFLTIIEDETVRLNEIVTSYLRFARPVPINPQSGDINKTIRETAALIRQEATENNVEVVMSLDEGIRMFKFDAQQIKQALLNILVNSLDATKAGGTIKIITQEVDSHVNIIVEDAGLGMSEEIISEMFKPFFTTKTRGSGLGLACVDRIVKDHRGSVSVRSSPGRGTEFIITLPAIN